MVEAREIIKIHAMIIKGGKRRKIYSITYNKNHINFIANCFSFYTFDWIYFNDKKELINSRTGLFNIHFYHQFVGGIV
jgi:hypothetical protein